MLLAVGFTCQLSAETAVVEMEHLKRENRDLRTELEVHKAMLNQAQDHRQLLQKVKLPWPASVRHAGCHAVLMSITPLTTSSRRQPCT